MRRDHIYALVGSLGITIPTCVALGWYCHHLFPQRWLEPFPFMPAFALALPMALWLEDHLLVWIARVRSFVRGTDGSPAAERKED